MLAAAKEKGYSHKNAVHDTTPPGKGQAINEKNFREIRWGLKPVAEQQVDQ